MDNIQYYIFGKSIYQHSKLFRTKRNKEKVTCLLTKLLEDIHKVLSEHNIRYIIVDGTLLGAMRDQKMIEWDDDIDIRVHNQDWKKYQDITHKFSDEYHISGELNGWWDQIHVRGHGKYDKLHADIVKSSYTNKIGSWKNVDKYFELPSDLIILNEVSVNGPNESLQIPYIEETYGKSWRNKVMYTKPFKEYINGGHAIFLSIAMILILCFCISRNRNSPTSKYTLAVEISLISAGISLIALVCVSYSQNNVLF